MVTLRTSKSAVRTGPGASRHRTNATRRPPAQPRAGQPACLFPQRGTLTPQKETEVVISSLTRWLPQHQDQTVAVLVPENSRGFHMTAALEHAGLSFDDSLLRSDSATRASAQALSTVMSYLARPHLPHILGTSMDRCMVAPQRGAARSRSCCRNSPKNLPAKLCRPASGAVRKAESTRTGQAVWSSPPPHGRTRDVSLSRRARLAG